MPLDRPPRAPAGAITGRVRRAILSAGERLGVAPPVMLRLHGEAEYLGGLADLVADAEERYALEPGSLGQQVAECLDAFARQSGPVSPYTQADVDANCVLLALPDTEFLTVLENCVEQGRRGQHLNAGMGEELFIAADGALRAHGAPYRRAGNAYCFEWVGDPKQHELTVEPALLALTDPRLVGSRGEFEEALGKRRDGTPKDLEDAVDEAAKSVESILQVLHDECGVPRSGKEPVLDLFTSLKKAQILPPYVTNLVTAAAGPRNHMASHGQGATLREVPEELADASIAAAATAITLLAHYLP